MNDAVREAVKCWANHAEWFSSHPTNVEAFRRAVNELKQLSPSPTFDEIKEAILFYVVDVPVTLGTPSNIHQTAHDFAKKIYQKL